jgi:hypothetical protein
MGGKKKERGTVIFAMYENIRNWQKRGERDDMRVTQIRIGWERVSYWCSTCLYLTFITCLA